MDWEEGRGEFRNITKYPLVTWVFEEGTFVPAAKITEKEKLSIVTNYLGTPEAMFREDGEKVWTCELNSYGKVRNFQGESKTMCNWRFQGQYEDAETGLYYNRFRYYSPEEGIYLSQDPIGMAGNNPTLYGYVKNTNWLVDIFGLECWSTARKNFWKQEAKNNPSKYSDKNRERMRDGNAPRMTVEVYNPKTNRIETKDYSLELHHRDTPQRVGGEGIHNSSNLKIVDPWEHAAEDKYRYVGVTKKEIKVDVGSWSN